MKPEPRATGSYKFPALRVMYLLRVLIGSLDCLFLCDWPKLLLWRAVYDTRLKTANLRLLLGQFPQKGRYLKGLRHGT